MHTNLVESHVKSAGQENLNLCQIPISRIFDTVLKLGRDYQVSKSNSIPIYDVIIWGTLGRFQTFASERFAVARRNVAASRIRANVRNAVVPRVAHFHRRTAHGTILLALALVGETHRKCGENCRRRNIVYDRGYRRREFAFRFHGIVRATRENLSRDCKSGGTSYRSVLLREKSRNRRRRHISK